MLINGYLGIVFSQRETTLINKKKYIICYENSLVILSSFQIKNAINLRVWQTISSSEGRIHIKQLSSIK